MSPIDRFFRYIYVTAGVLIAASCGGCTLWWVAVLAYGLMQASEGRGVAFAMAIPALIVGGGFTFAGVWIVRWNLRDLRRAREPKPPPSDPPQA